MFSLFADILALTTSMDINASTEGMSTSISADSTTAQLVMKTTESMVGTQEQTVAMAITTGFPDITNLVDITKDQTLQITEKVTITNKTANETVTEEPLVIDLTTKQPNTTLGDPELSTKSAINVDLSTAAVESVSGEVAIETSSSTPSSKTVQDLTRGVTFSSTTSSNLVDDLTHGYNFTNEHIFTTGTQEQTVAMAITTGFPDITNLVDITKDQTLQITEKVTITNKTANETVTEEPLVIDLTTKQPNTTLGDPELSTKSAINVDLSTAAVESVSGEVAIETSSSTPSSKTVQDLTRGVTFSSTTSSNLVDDLTHGYNFTNEHIFTTDKLTIPGKSAAQTQSETLEPRVTRGALLQTTREALMQTTDEGAKSTDEDIVTNDTGVIYTTVTLTSTTPSSSSQSDKSNKTAPTQIGGVTTADINEELTVETHTKDAVIGDSSTVQLDISSTSSVGLHDDLTTVRGRDLSSQRESDIVTTTSVSTGGDLLVTQQDHKVSALPSGTTSQPQVQTTEPQIEKDTTEANPILNNVTVPGTINLKPQTSPIPDETMTELVFTEQDTSGMQNVTTSKPAVVTGHFQTDEVITKTTFSPPIVSEVRPQNTEITHIPAATTAGNVVFTEDKLSGVTSSQATTTSRSGVNTTESVVFTEEEHKTDQHQATTTTENHIGETTGSDTTLVKAETTYVPLITTADKIVLTTQVDDGIVTTVSENQKPKNTANVVQTTEYDLNLTTDFQTERHKTTTRILTTELEDTAIKTTQPTIVNPKTTMSILTTEADDIDVDTRISHIPSVLSETTTSDSKVTDNPTVDHHTTKSKPTPIKYTTIVPITTESDGIVTSASETVVHEVETTADAHSTIVSQHETTESGKVTTQHLLTARSQRTTESLDSSTTVIPVVTTQDEAVVVSTAIDSKERGTTVDTVPHETEAHTDAITINTTSSIDTSISTSITATPISSARTTAKTTTSSDSTTPLITGRYSIIID